MKKNTKFDLLFASISATALLLFMSCGHQSRRGDDGLFADMEQDKGSESSEVNVPSESSGDSAAKKEISTDLVATSDSDASKMIEDKSAEANKPMDPTSLGEDKSAKGGDDLSALTDAKPAAETSKVAQLDTAPPSAESLPPMEETAPASIAAPEVKPEAAKPEAALPPMDSSKSASELLAQITVPSPDAMTAAPSEMPAPAAEPAKKVSSAPKSARKSSKASSSLPKDSMWKKGHTMNRFYFLRSGDTAEKVADMIYGDKTKAEELANWNPGTWTAGKVIVYESAVTPNDTEMKSFYEERELPTQAYTVKKGEKLASIAQAVYGDKQSWSEIAAFNNLPKNAKLAEGTVINLFPAAIPAAEKEEHVAEKPAAAPQESNEQKIAAIVAAKEPVKDEPVAKAAPEPEAKMVRRERASKASLANAQIGGGFLEEHIAAMLGGMLILLASFFAFRYFRRSHELQD